MSKSVFWKGEDERYGSARVRFRRLELAVRWTMCSRSAGEKYFFLLYVVSDRTWS